MILNLNLISRSRLQHPLLGRTPFKYGIAWGLNAGQTQNENMDRRKCRRTHPLSLKIHSAGIVVVLPWCFTKSRLKSNPDCAHLTKISMDEIIIPLSKIMHHHCCAMPLQHQLSTWYLYLRWFSASAAYRMPGLHISLSFLSWWYFNSAWWLKFTEFGAVGQYILAFSRAAIMMDSTYPSSSESTLLAFFIWLTLVFFCYSLYPV
jgi:hypothetical protein